MSTAYELIRGSNQQIVDTQMAMLRRYYPLARDAQVIHSHVVRMPHSTFAQRPQARIRADFGRLV